MGVYKAAVVTESGQNLIAQAFTSEKKLIFTSAKHPVILIQQGQISQH